MLKILFTLIATLGALQASGADPTELADMVEQPIQLPRVWLCEKPLGGKLDPIEEKVLRRIKMIPESEIPVGGTPSVAVLNNFFQQKAGLPVVDAILEETFPGYSTALFDQILKEFEDGSKTSSTPQEIETLESIYRFVYEISLKDLDKKFIKGGECVKIAQSSEEWHALVLDRSTPEARDMNNVYWAQSISKWALMHTEKNLEKCLKHIFMARTESEIDFTRYLLSLYSPI